MKYVSSPLETEWLSGDVTGRICSLSASQRRDVELSLVGDTSKLSYFSERGETKWIEPITGVGRHPLANVGCPDEGKKTVSIFDTSYLVFHKGRECEEKSRGAEKKRRNIFFDLGCSVFGPRSSPSALGPSIPFFLEEYEKACHPMDRIFAWEARKQTKWWRHVPDSIKYKTHFYNEPVAASDLEAALLSSVREEDFVAIKLDIDNTEEEMKILDVIKKRHSLVDELFFEYHYFFDGLDFGWGENSHLKSFHNATSAVRRMVELRKLGIRSHFWI